MRILYYFPLPGKCRKGYSSIHYEMLHASTMNQTNRESLPFPWGNIHMQLHCNSSFDEFPMQLLYRSPACNPRHKPDVHCHKHPGTVAPHPLVDPALDLLRNVHVETWINKPFMRALIKVSVRSGHVTYQKGFWERIWFATGEAFKIETYINQQVFECSECHNMWRPWIFTTIGKSKTKITHPHRIHRTGIFTNSHFPMFMWPYFTFHVGR